jgi:glycosyltransferase involved in cell wall biosynthesis
MTTPDISIVVCTQNRAGMLHGALASLYDLATDDAFTYEIVVIDNASTDTTAQTIAEATAASKNPLRGVHEPVKGLVPARNRGIREARGRWIAFFDDDQLADHRWLAELFRGALEQNSRVVGGAVHLKFPGGCDRSLHPAVRMLLGETALAGPPRRYGGRLTPGCGNLMVERSVFDEVGLFERTISGRGEDTDLFARIDRAGIASWYFPTAIVHHLTPPERLENPYLLKLARAVGEGVAVRQAARLGAPRLAVLWLAKCARNAWVHWPMHMFAALLGDYETAAGRLCLIELNRAFLRTAAELLLNLSPLTTTHIQRSAPAITSHS